VKLNTHRHARSLILSASLGMLVLVLAACAPISAPTPASTSAPAAASNTIVDISWQWQSVTNRTDQTTTTVPNPEDYTIIFRADGTLSGTADCNAYGGTYTQENGFIITLGPTTMAYCGEASLDQQYLQLLSEVVAGGPDGAGGLALENAGGEKRMSFLNGGAAPIP